MKVLLIGAGGDVGGAILEVMGDLHEVIRVGRSGPDIRADVDKVEDIRAMYEQAGTLDAVICAVGHGHFGPVRDMSGEQFMKGMQHKVLPQVNLVLEGLERVVDGGSFTLTSGILNRDHIRGGAAAAAANGAIDAFVRAASLEMPRSIRINAVSAGYLEVSRNRYEKAFPGHVPISSFRVGMAYRKCAEGVINGQVVTLDA